MQCNEIWKYLQLKYLLEQEFLTKKKRKRVLIDMGDKNCVVNYMYLHTSCNLSTELKKTPMWHYNHNDCKKVCVCMYVYMYIYTYTWCVTERHWALLKIVKDKFELQMNICQERARCLTITNFPYILQATRWYIQNLHLNFLLCSKLNS